MNSDQTYDLCAFKYGCIGGVLFIVSTLLLLSGTVFKLVMGLFFITTVVNSLASYFIFKSLSSYFMGKKRLFIYYPSILLVIGYAILSAYAFLNILFWDYLRNLFRTMFYVPNYDGSYLVTFLLLLPIITVLFFIFLLTTLYWKQTMIENSPTVYLIMSLLIFVVMGVTAFFVDIHLICDLPKFCDFW